METMSGREAFEAVLARHLEAAASPATPSVFVAACRALARLEFSSSEGNVDADELRIEYDDGELGTAASGGVI